MADTGSDIDLQRVISMQNLSQLGLQTIGLLVGGQIFQSLSMRYLTQVLHGLGLSQADIKSAMVGTRSALLTHLSPEIQRDAIAVFTRAMSKVYILSIAAGAITTLCAALMKKEKLFKESSEKVVIAGGA
ncbi:MFS drug efflux transporter [Apiospora rasikravindrae]|uniref:MFS drug efflux transporter n=1 Tax=Apiospora rasikravindrae TaxID=990691 RepID=A0ABR1SK50_9PEZI